MSEAKPRFQVLVCDGPSCGLCHESAVLAEEMEAQVEADPALRGRVDITNLTCFGRCDEGPNIMVRPLDPGEDGSFEPDFERLSGVRGLYLSVDSEKVKRILSEHAGAGTPVEGWVEEYD